MAEGVETKEQLEYLRENGCDYVQGYYFSRPVPRQEFEQFLSDLSGKGIVSHFDEKCHICMYCTISQSKREFFRILNLIHDIPGGVSCYQVENNQFTLTFFSDGVVALTGYTREEYGKMAVEDPMALVYEADRGRVLEAALKALTTGELLDVSYRIYDKDGGVNWIHLNGRRVGPLEEVSQFYMVFTCLSSKTRQFQSILNETADSIYIIDKENYELLYANMLEDSHKDIAGCTGQKCYAVLHDKNAPCE
ncbi:MAG: PAS domain-containing protein, partial [Muricomes sp.]